MEEATCLLNLAHASRGIEESRRNLARQRAKEYRCLAQLYELQARNANGRLSDADLDIGRATSAVRHSGSFTLPSPAMALRRYGSTRGTMIYHTLAHLLIVLKDFAIAICPLSSQFILTDYGHIGCSFIFTYTSLQSAHPIATFKHIRTLSPPCIRKDVIVL